MFSIGYINARIRGYEMRDGNCTVLTAYITAREVACLYDCDCGL